MEVETEWSKVEEFLYTIYMGLWVLVVYVRWFAGLDIFFSLYLRRIKKREEQLESEIAYTSAVPNGYEKEKLEPELKLVKKDRCKMEEKRREAFVVNCIQVLQKRFSTVSYTISS